MKRPPFVYLASRSPRRRELLEQIGVAYRLIEVGVEESRHRGEPPESYVARIAKRKAMKGWEAAAAESQAPVLGADTAVVLDGQVLGKPVDAAQAGDMLAKLSARTHEVLSAVCLTRGEPVTRMNRSLVTFRAVSARERAEYCASGEPLDKAGAYAIQGRAAVFVSKLEGSYSGVVGLPLFETAELLAEFGIGLFGANGGQVPGR